jgi:hypothetical protein
MTATTLLDGHNTAIGTPTRLTYNTDVRQKRDALDHAYRARTRPVAGSRTSSTTTMDLATWTYDTVSFIIRTGAVKTAQHSTVHTRVWNQGADVSAQTCGPTGEVCALGTGIQPVPPGGLSAGRWEWKFCSCAEHCQLFELHPPLHHLPTRCRQMVSGVSSNVCGGVMGGQNRLRFENGW